MQQTTEITLNTNNPQEFVAPVLKAANDLVVDCHEALGWARDGKLEIKRRLAVINDHCDPGIKQAHQLHKQLVADKKKLTDELEQADRIINGKVSAYHIEQERKAEAENLRLQKEAEWERQRTIDDANLKMEAALKNTTTLEEKITAAQQILDDPASTDMERELAERQITIYQMQLNGLQDRAREEQEKVQEVAESVVYVTPVAVQQERVKGMSSRKVYKVVGIDPMTLIKAIAEGRAPLTVLKAWDKAFDLTALGKMKTLGMSHPGVAYQEDYSISTRS